MGDWQTHIHRLYLFIWLMLINKYVIYYGWSLHFSSLGYLRIKNSYGHKYSIDLNWNHKCHLITADQVSKSTPDRLWRLSVSTMNLMCLIWEVVYIHGAAIYIVTFYIVQSRILNVRDRPRAIINQPPIKIKMRIDRR